MEHTNGGSPSTNRGNGRAGLLADLGQELRALRSDLTAATALGRQTAGEVAELLPRLDALEAHLTRTEQPSPSPGDGPTHAVTPALAWSFLDADQLRAAWEALVRWVGDVLCDGMALSRTELPDCWPLHRRAVLELAWLRSMYFAAAAPDASPALTAEWHSRWLPSALHNLTDAIDQRECGPGFHRLTREERGDYLHACGQARRDGAPDPDPSPLRCPDRPRVVFAHVPAPRGNRTRSLDGAPLSIDAEEASPVGPSRPEYWLGYYREASATDVATRAQS